MLLGGNETTRKIDSFAINELKIPSIVLMENAAISFVKHIDENENNFLIICGKGNNGGDGYAIARQLFSKNKKQSTNTINYARYIIFILVMAVGVGFVIYKYRKDKRI